MAIKDVILGYAKGDKGDRGPQGEKGNTGATGPKGDPGNIADAQITDTEGLDVAKGQKTTAQKLFDAIANRIVTKLVTNDALTKKLADYMLKGMMSNTNVNNTGTVPTSALMYSMFEQINSDLNSLLKPTTEVVNIDENIENGTYVIGTGMSGTKPFEYGILIQFKRYSYTVQIAIDIDSAAIAKRQMNNGRWNDWDFYVVKSDIPNLHYTIQSSVINNPTEVIKKQWASMPDGYYLCEMRCGAAYIAIIQRIDSGQHGSVIIHGYGTEVPVYLRRVNGEWI